MNQNTSWVYLVRRIWQYVSYDTINMELTLTRGNRKACSYALITKMLRADYSCTVASLLTCEITNMSTRTKVESSFCSTALNIAH